MSREFTQIQWDEQLADDCRQLARLAVREDLDRGHDWTTLSLLSADQTAQVAVVVRESGVIAGLPAAQIVLDEMNIKADWTSLVDDAIDVAKDTVVAQLSGNARDLLTSERLLLNFIGHLSGIATLTEEYTSAVANTKTKIYDTRKTTPGWRRLEKYAVRCGGGTNHRTGLFDAILIKDNHLAVAGDQQLGPAQSVEQAREFAQQLAEDSNHAEPMIIEVEVDTLDQLRDVIAATPDIVLLDNMTLDELRQAVEMRNGSNPDTVLEASGGINLSTVAAIAETGIDRISVGALTHSAPCLDVGMDWN